MFPDWQVFSSRNTTFKEVLRSFRNTIFDDVFFEVNKYFVSENTFNRCDDGFNNDSLSISDNKKYGISFSAVIKTSTF